MKRIPFYLVFVAGCLLLSPVVYGATFTDSFDDPVFTNSNWTITTDIQQVWSFPVLSGSDLGLHVSTTSTTYPAAMSINNETLYATANLYVETLVRLDSSADSYSLENAGGFYFMAPSGNHYAVAIQLDFDGPTAIDLNITRDSENLIKTSLPISFDTFYKMVVHIDSNNIMTASLYSLDGSLLGKVSTGSALAFDSGIVGIHGSPEITFNNFMLTTNTADDVNTDTTVIWPMARHDTRNTGYSAYTGPSTSTLAWRFLLPSTVVSASPVIGTDGTIYIGNGAGGSGGVFAINPDGTQKWLSPGHTGDNTLAIATDGTVYTAGYYDFRAINPDGTLRWTYHAQNDFNYASPTIGQDGTIYIGCGIDLLALSPVGNLLWQYRVGDDIQSTPAIATDGTIYVRSGNDYLSAVNRDGSQKWILNLGSKPNFYGISPVITADGTIYTNGLADYTRSDDSVIEVNSLYAINPDGTTKWIYNAISPGGMGGIGTIVPALDLAGNIYLGGKVNDLSTEAFFALNSLGKLLWSYQLSDPLGKSSPSIDVNGTIYFGAGDNLYTLNSDGTLKWKLAIDIGGSSPAIGSSGMLYFGSGDGYLNAIGDSVGTDLPTLLTQTQVSQLYVSIFGRASEGEGNAYWQSEQSDMTVAANTMLNTEPAKAYFGTTLNDNQMFIEFIYKNTLGKDYADDTDGVNYWVSELAAGKSKGEVVATLISAAIDPQYAGLAAQDQFLNKVEVSNYTAETIATVPDVNDLSAFVNFISNVTDDTATVVAAKAAVDAF